MIQNNLLKILFVEDVPSDVDLAVLELRKENIKFSYTTVSNKNDLLKALKEFNPDLIISDYMMPSFNGLQALKETKLYDPDLPFILYTGSVNEETAVECIKAGAQDYVIKEHMTRLPFAVKEALEQVLINKEKKASELLLKENEEKLQSIFSAAPVGIGLVVDRILIEVNDTFCQITGYNRSELIGKSSEIFYPSNDEYESAIKEFFQNFRNGAGFLESRIKTKDGRILDVIFNGTLLDREDRLKGFTFTVLDITERKKAENKLARSIKSMSTLIGNLQGIVYRCRNDKNWTMEFMSEGTTELTGYNSEELLLNNKISYSDLIYNEDREAVRAEVQAAINEKRHFQSTYRILTKSNELRWVWEKGEGIFSPDGKLEFLEGFITDITERKKIEEALAESELKYRQLVMQSPDGIFIIDLKGNFISINKAICDNLKYTEEELLSMNILNVVPQKYHELQKKRMESIYKGESYVSDAEYDVTGKDNVVHTVEVLSAPYYKGKEIIGFQSIARDITQRKLTENLIKESEEKYRSIFENVQDVYFETSISGTILEVSPSITTLSKGEYQMKDLIGGKIFDYYADLNERHILLSDLQNKGTITDFEVNLKNSDGSIIPCSISAKLVLNNYGLPDKIIGSMHDITDRKNATEALRIAKEKAEASDKLKTEFLNNISHEVRTPLNGILGFAEIISLQDLSEAEKKDSLAMLFESSNRLLNTITNYMDISLISSGNLSVNKKDFNPTSVLSKIYSDFEPLCLSRNLELMLEIPEKTEGFYINSDPEICKKIITHFLDNAVKFTESGTIKFGFTTNNRHLEFFVKDTGIGISKDSFVSIFDKFVKEKNNNLYKTSEGSGLGLSIARGMSDAIGGKINLESIPGAGSSFYLLLPLNKNSGAFANDVWSEDVTKISTGSPILVAEDDETNFYYLNALLSRETKIKIIHALNGREAIDLFKANRDIRLILMDMKMPEVDGFEATKQIKLIDKNVHIIAITAYAMSGDEERIIAAGCDDYLSKPINKKNLLEKISEYIKV